VNCCKEGKERKAQVRTALYGAYFESDADRDSAIESFTKADLTIEEILRLVQPLKEISTNAAKSKSKIFGSNSRVMSGIA
jgi:hypothetical protein